jgi:hypothetical protein
LVEFPVEFGGVGKITKIFQFELNGTHPQAI